MPPKQKPNITNYPFTHNFEVRDYECDLQGIVNNAVYQNYLEHTRHEFLKSKGHDFAEVTAQGTHLVITRAEIDYLTPLKSGDKFTVGLSVTKQSPLRITFNQAIFHKKHNICMLKAQLTATALNKQGKPFACDILSQLCETEHVPT